MDVVIYQIMYCYFLAEVISLVLLPAELPGFAGVSLQRNLKSLTHRNIFQTSEIPKIIWVVSSYP